MMTFRTLKTEEFDRWVEHCALVFVDDDAAYFRRHFQMDPTADLSLVFVAMDGDTIAATLRVFQRTIWLHGRAVAMGGIGEVSTKVDYRRKGLAAELLQMAIAAMEERDIPVSLLFGDQRIYSNAGWRDCIIPRIRIDISHLPEGSGITLGPFERDDLPAIMGMYDLFAGRLDGTVLRDEAYWKSWVLPQWTPPLVAVEEGQCIAYACTKKLQEGNDSILRLEEFCAAPQAWKQTGQILRAFAQANACGRVQTEPALCPDIQGDAIRRGGMMVRLNRPVEDLHTSEELVASMQNAGMFPVDHF